MKIIRLALLLIAVFANAPVSADGPVQPGIYWRVDFGHRSVTSFNYGMAIRQARADRPMAALPAIATLDFHQQGSTATLAGLPLWRRQYRLDQNEAVPESDTSWLTSTSTLAIAGGVVAAAVLLSGGDQGAGQADVPQNSPCAVEGPVGGCSVQCPDGTVDSCIGAIPTSLLESAFLIEAWRPR